MLAEFMLTPDALLAGFSRGGREAIEELEMCFLPKRATPVALLSKPGDEWVSAATKRIARINGPLRNDAMATFQRLLDNASLARPSVSVRSDDEIGWIQVAQSSNSQVAFERIVVSPSATPPTGNGVALTDFLNDAFW